jgi:hypothetical protein
MNEPGKDARILLVRLIGGLGNQLFQYATGYALARETGRRLMVTGRELSDYPDPQPFQLGIFGIPDETEPQGTRDTLVYSDFPTRENLDELRGLIRDSTCDIFDLCGYWQNEAGFSSCAADIRRKLWLPPGELPETEGRTPVCLQIRRGIFQQIDLHNVCDESYYLNAMKVVGAFIPHPHYIVVSDGIEWCRSFLKGEHITFYGKKSGREDFRVMYRCRAFIISNSSYGWWPAWVTNAPLVVRPSRWINTNDWTSKDWRVYPERWIALPGCGPLL